MSHEARPFHLLGRSRLGQVALRVQQCLPALSRDWWQQENRIQLISVSMWNEEFRASALRYVLRGAEGRWLALLGAEAAWLKLAESWLGCEVAVEGPLVSALRRGFCHALYRQLVGRDESAVVLDRPAWSDVPAGALATGGGTLVIELDVEAVPITVLSPVVLWADLASWSSPASVPGLQQVASALAANVVQVEVRLPGVRVPVTDMGSLTVGDFLDLEYDLSGRVHLVGVGAQINVSAMLGQCAGSKAVKIDSQNGSTR